MNALSKCGVGTPVEMNIRAALISVGVRAVGQVAGGHGEHQANTTVPFTPQEGDRHLEFMQSQYLALTSSSKSLVTGAGVPPIVQMGKLRLREASRQEKSLPVSCWCVHKALCWVYLERGPVVWREEQRVETPAGTAAQSGFMAVQPQPSHLTPLSLGAHLKALPAQGCLSYSARAPPACCHDSGSAGPLSQGPKDHLTHAPNDGAGGDSNRCSYLGRQAMKRQDVDKQPCPGTELMDHSHAPWSTCSSTGGMSLTWR